MTNYYVTAKSTNERGVITHLKVHQNNNGFLGSAQIWERSQVIDSIDAGFIFYTIYKDRSSDKWNLGSQIHVVNGSYGRYLRTDRNNIPFDNLDSLPEFYPGKVPSLS